MNTPYKEGITANTAGLLISTDVTANYAGQLWVAKSDGTTFARGKGSGTWSAWRQLADISVINRSLILAYDRADGAAWQMSDAEGTNMSFYYNKSTKKLNVDVRVNGTWQGRKEIASW